MTKLEAIAAAKTFRKDADELLQRMKEHKNLLLGATALRQLTPEEKLLPPTESINDISEAIAQHTLSIRDLESAIMRQGMVLKSIGNPNPYPESYNPASSVVAPTADGLKL